MPSHHASPRPAETARAGDPPGGPAAAEAAPIFVVGQPRSGTTLLSMVLNAHPDLAIAPETHYFDRFVPYCRHHRCLASPHRYRRYVARFLGNLPASAYGFTREDLFAVRKDILSRPEPSHPVVLGALLEHFARKHGKTRWGEKTPAHFRHVDAILDAFPDARFVNVIRDPRAVALSTTKTAWVRTNFVSNAASWKVNARLADNPRLNPGNFHEIRFEDLLTAPETSVRRLCDFLAVPFQAAMLDHAREARANFDPRSEPWKENALRPIDPARVDGWREEMDPSDARLIGFLAGGALAAKNYPPAEGPYGPRFWLKLVAAGTAHFADEARGRLHRAIFGTLRKAPQKDCDTLE